MLADKNWLQTSITGMPSLQKTPMYHDTQYNKHIEEAEQIPESEFKAVEKRWNLHRNKE